MKNKQWRQLRRIPIVPISRPSDLSKTQEDRDEAGLNAHLQGGFNVRQMA